MPTPRRQLVVAAVNNKIYAIGGVDFSSDPNNVTYSYATEEYDPGADTWTIKATMPAGGAVNGVLGNRFIGGAAANGKIYIAAYSNPGAPSLTHALEYNPSTDTWTSKASPPFTYSRYAVTSLNDKLYALSDLGLLAEYDPLKDYWILRLPTSTWRFLKPVPGRRWR